jgi:hypothetical protein
MFTLAIASAMLRRIGALAPLALLQDNSGGKRTRGGKKAALPEPPSIHKAEIAAVVPSEGSSARSYTRNGSSPRFILRYILLHTRRAARKSALALLLAALLLGAVGQFAMMRQSYADLCENTAVKANFAGGVQLAFMSPLVKNGYAANPYYETERTVSINFDVMRVIITNNIARYTGEEPEITYADGYDASCLDKLGTVLVVGKKAMERYGLALGDTVEVFVSIEYLVPLWVYIDDIRANHPEYVYSDGEILNMYSDHIRNAIGLQMCTFTIAGSISSPSGKYNTEVFTPGTNDLSGILGSTTTLASAEFTLADYRLADTGHYKAQDTRDTRA